MGGGIVVAEIELTEFGAAQTSCVEEFEHGAVAQAEGIGGVGNGKEKVDFFGGEAFGEGAGLFAGEFEIGGGVGRDEALAAEPGEEASDAAETGDLGVDDEGFVASRGAVMVKVKLIGCEVGAGEVFDMDMGVLAGPGAELAERPLVGNDRCVGVGAGC